MRRMTLAMLAIATLLGVALWATTPSTPTDTRLTPLAVEAVSHIRLTRNGQLIADLEKGDAGWRMVAPLRGPASTARVAELLQLPAARSFRRLPLPADPAPFGLRPPRAVFRYDQTELAFGDVEPVNHKRYVATGGRLHLIHDRFARLALSLHSEDFLAGAP